MDSTHILLSLDLNNKTPTQNRDAVYAYLSQKNFRKLPSTTTLWTAYFNGMSDENVTAAVKAHVAAAATYGQVTSYDATMAICQSPISWKV